MLKNITLSILFISVLDFTCKAQFTINNDTLWADGSANDFELVAYVKIKNITNKPDTIIWTRTENAIPSNWTSAVCDIMQCFGETVSSSEFILDSAREEDMSFHFYPASNNGIGKMVVRFERKSDPSYYVDIVTTAQAYGLGLKSLTAGTFKVFPNPASDFIILGNEQISEGRFEIYNLLGEMVMQNIFAEKQKIDISTLTKGIYLINIQNGSSTSAGKLLVE